MCVDHQFHETSRVVSPTSTAVCRMLLLLPVLRFRCLLRHVDCFCPDSAPNVAMLKKGEGGLTKLFKLYFDVGSKLIGSSSPAGFQAPCLEETAASSRITNRTNRWLVGRLWQPPTTLLISRSSAFVPLRQPRKEANDFYTVSTPAPRRWQGAQCGGSAAD